MRKITVELIKKYQNQLIYEEKSALTIEKYLRDIKMFVKRFGSVEITKEAVIEYKRGLTTACKRILSVLPIYSAIHR